MNLFYTINDKYVPQLGAAICSVCENNREADSLHFYIGALDVSEESQRLLTELTESYSRDISFIPIWNLRQQLDFEFDTTAWNEVVLARLLVDHLLPREVDRVLYMDGDTIVLESLENLWDTDMQGRVLGACVEPTANHKRKKELGLETLPYYNSGVLLMDLSLWRKQKTEERILKYYQAHGGRLFAPDQDAINGALAGEIYTLSPKYNWFNVFWYYPYKTLVQMQKPVPFITEDEFRKIKGSPCIIHYLGEDRPWRKGNTHRYAKEYQHYLSMTSWKNMPVEEGWETYFFFYGAFWKILKPFPMLQYRIMDVLIPWVLKKREKQRKRSQTMIKA